MKKVLLILLALPLVFISSCKDDTPAPKTKTELLCASPWKITSATVNPGVDFGGGTLVTDFYAQMENCTKDDLTKFDANKTGINDEGATKCDPADPQTTPFNWSFDLTESIITYDGESYNVVELTESSLKLSIVYDGADIGGTPGVKYTMTMSLKH